MNEYEWLFDDTRLILYDWFLVTKLMDVYTGNTNIFMRFEDQETFVKAMNQEGVTAVFVRHTTRYYKNRQHRQYWVLSFKSSHHATLFKLKYAPALC